MLDSHYFFQLIQFLSADTQRRTAVSQAQHFFVDAQDAQSVVPEDAVRRDAEHFTFLLYDAFLLVGAPGIGCPRMIEFNNIPTSVVYNIDAYVNSFHHAVQQIDLPTCEAFDIQTWWVSQNFMVGRSTCHFGHTIMIHDVFNNQDGNKHREYTKSENVDKLYRTRRESLNLVPEHLKPLLVWSDLQQLLMPIRMEQYSGFSKEFITKQCFEQTYDPLTCKYSPA